MAVTHNFDPSTRLGAVEEMSIHSLADVRKLFDAIGAQCQTVLQGRDETIALVLIGLFADGHVLLEDHPGSGKTTLAKALGESIRRSSEDGFAPYRRIQFTPDLLPSDITGGMMFDAESRQFLFRPGPVFANLILADEINRTSPKAQAALLEAMAEKQVTIDNQTYRLEELFFVIATQNPLDLAGTYPLPRAQLDRFLFKIKMTYLDRAHELEVLSRRRNVRSRSPGIAVSPQTLIAARRLMQDAVKIAPAIHDCLVDIAAALRADRRVALAISTRSLVMSLPALQARAMMLGRDYVAPKDVQALAVPMFAHRLELVPGVKDADQVVRECTAPIVETLTRKSLAG